MRLRNPSDKAMFLADTGRLDLLSSLDITEDISTELYEDFIKRRKPLTAGLVNFRKSQQTKQGWRSSRYKHLRGIHKFHRSIEGKRFHRGLSRFLATHITRTHGSTSKSLRGESLDALQCETLKGLSSLRTHLYIENDYYMPLQENIEFVSFLEYSIPLLNNIELKIFHDATAELTEDETELLLRLCDEKELCKSFAELFEEITPDKVFDTYKAIQGRMLSEGSSLDETSFYSRLVENFLPCLFDLYKKTDYSL